MKKLRTIVILMILSITILSACTEEQVNATTPDNNDKGEHADRPK